jgi:NAD(P)-dependent dehydrogenase (short-subunit alcohol dehydrogenase family)
MTGTVLIYGGSGGVGSALARRLVAAGTRVHLAGRNAAALAGLAAELGAGHTVGDVTDAGFFARATAEAATPLHGLVYAVGTLSLRSLARVSDEDAVHDFRVNALGAALAVQAAAGALKTAPGGSVVLFSSVAASHGFSNHASIAMAKGAVEGLTVSLAAELAPLVRVNAIAPSLTRTPLAEPLVANPQMAAAIEKMHPLGRLGSADDLAAAAAFLLSDDSAWMTGQVLRVDGGRGTLQARG